MTILEASRKLGAAIQQDERFIRYAKAKIANDTDETLQKNIGEFNVTRMELDRVANEEVRDEEKVRELNEKLRSIYAEVMSSSVMAEYNAAKSDLDRMLNDINSVIMQCVEGAVPETCEPEQPSCTGSCSTCGGCH
ncbi:MAG: YlbF family regulator [Ruminococcaceae bacterium]|nr:YlbF family regulator [Oscillospiraceae bacterium]